MEECSDHDLNKSDGYDAQMIVIVLWAFFALIIFVMFDPQTRYLEILICGEKLLHIKFFAPQPFSAMSATNLMCMFFCLPHPLYVT